MKTCIKILYNLYKIKPQVKNLKLFRKKKWKLDKGMYNLTTVEFPITWSSAEDATLKDQSDRSDILRSSCSATDALRKGFET